MFVGTMSYDDIVGQFKDDIVYVFPFLTHKIQDCIKSAKKAHRFPVSKAFEWQRKEDRYIIYLNVKGKKYEDWDFLAYPLVDGADGISLLDVVGAFLETPSYCVRENNFDRTPIVEYSPHFFARYKSRLGLKEEGVGLRMRFIVNNDMLIANVVKGIFRDHGGDYETLAVMNEGIGLGIAEGRRIVIKTFLPYDMLNGKQKDYVETTKRVMERHKHSLNTTPVWENIRDYESKRRKLILPEEQG